MNDNRFNDDEVFEEGEQQPEANESGTGKNAALTRICIAVMVVFGVVIIILVSVLLGLKQNKGEETTVDETTTLPVEITTAPEERYEIGQYTVNVGGTGTLNLRKEPTKDAEQLISVPHGTLLNITEIKYDAQGDDKTQFWGKADYLGWTGWVSMTYLVKAYTEGIVTPGELTTAAVESTTGTEDTTGAESTTAPETTTAAPEVTTAAPEATTSSGAGSAYSTGKYTVDAQPHLNMRDDHSVNALAIAQIPDNAEVTVVDVYYDSNSTDSYTKYWGKVTYGGITGWVAMGYLE